MPTIDISLKDLRNLMGMQIPFKELEEEGILYVKGEIDSFSGDELKIDCKETNRPDLWSTEGIARQLKPYYTKERGVPKYKINTPKIEVKVEKGLKNIRPYFVAAVIKNIKITDDLIAQIVQLQEKVCLTFGRKRKEAAIGLYDYDKLAPPLKYKPINPEGIRFKPLGFKIEMTPGEILDDHPKGQEYKHLLEKFKKYPLVIDSKNKVASLPPIINSDYTGKVTEKTKNLFVEVTGNDLNVIKIALNVMVSALGDRGGQIEAVRIKYPDKNIITPDFKPKTMIIDKNYLQQISGFKLTNTKIKELLEKARYNVKFDGNKIKVEYPSYRQDILHPIDVIEDLIISYGYNDIAPFVPEIATIGELDEFGVFCEKVRDYMVGIGAQEILTFTLTNKEMLFEKMNTSEWSVVEIANPISSQWAVLRNWVMPSLMEFLSKNTSETYPQQIYEVGDAVIIDDKKETKTKDIKRLAWAYTGKEATFTYAKQVLNYILSALNLDYEIVNVEHSSFIKGRAGRIIVNGKKIAYIGEVNPQVLDNFGLKMPVTAFELNLTDLYELI
ncbi:MAG: phenylalanine--tRNA ligase subunit beta [Nanoarchaeota archaeon]|nr:phenylalanine--tRNA ligase subunit beta [Nanoarchaeota archaeon]